MSRGAVNRSMKKRGSCGLKHARYDTSCRLCAARCLLVQNSLTNVSTTMGRDFDRPTLVMARLVGRPFHRNARSSRMMAGCGDWDAGRRWGAVRIDRFAVRDVRGSVELYAPLRTFRPRLTYLSAEVCRSTAAPR